MISRTISFIAAALLLGCNHSPRAASGSAPGSSPSADLSAPGDDSLPSAGPLAKVSLYDLRLDLTDQDGAKRQLGSFAGRPLIISMFYGTCPYACPTLIRAINRGLAKADPATRAETRVLLVSFDPERDTPAALKEIASLHHLDETRWRLARASDDDVRQLAAVLGIRYRKLADGAFNHSSVITVLDARGMPRFRQDGLGDPPDRLAAALRAATSVRATGAVAAGPGEG